MSNHPAKVPSYIKMDSASPWHISALQCLALETMTMPSRLRESQAGQATLQELEQTINQNGNRRIAKLEMSIADPESLAEKTTTKFERANTTESREDDDVERNLARFDIDVFTQDYRVGSKTNQKKEHVFGRVETVRGEWNTRSDGSDPRDRYSEGPTVQRYVSLAARIVYREMLVALSFKGLRPLSRRPPGPSPTGTTSELTYI
jgi:hypothetical protein